MNDFINTDIGKYKAISVASIINQAPSRLKLTLTLPGVRCSTHMTGQSLVSVDELVIVKAASSACFTR